jgi:uncharacterized protein YbcI
MSLPENTQLSDRISTEIAAIHRDSYGDEVESIRTYLLDDMVLCIMDITLLAHERTLLTHGGSIDGVRRTRQQFQEAIGPTFMATIEHHTGRRVVGFLSDTHVEPNFTVEIFRLAPATESAAVAEPE